MSSRSRNARNSSRAGGVNQEEINVWNSIKTGLNELIPMVNENNEDIRAVVAQDSNIHANGNTIDRVAEDTMLESLLRKGVKSSNVTKEQIDQVIEQVQLLQALQAASNKEREIHASSGGLTGRERGSSSHPSASGRASARGLGAASRGKEKEERAKEERDKVDPYDIEGADGSPVPSPMGSHTKRIGSSVGASVSVGGAGAGAGGGAGSDISASRESVPPRSDTPSKAGSVPPENAHGSSSAAAAAARAKITFIKGQDVVFRPKPSTQNEHPDWVLGRVQQVLGEGKARRYKVQDADPDLPPEQRSEFRTSASSMIPIPPLGADLPPLDVGKTVLAEYPDSTTFYKAEVMGTDPATGKVSLRFAGEENLDTLQLVERRKVVEFRP